MRITIDTDDKGNVHIDTGDKGTEGRGLFESTKDIPVVDAGPAPFQEVERQQAIITQTEGGGVSAGASPQDREAQLPLNPLRAGAAAAYRNPANLRNTAAPPEGAPAAAQDLSIGAIDGGSARIPGDKKPTGEREPAKSGKRDKKR
jgi:hypothetical protein